MPLSLRTTFLFLALSLVAMVPQSTSAQCIAELSIDEFVPGGQTVSNSFELAGNLVYVDIALYWQGGGSSWPVGLATHGHSSRVQQPW